MVSCQTVWLGMDTDLVAGVARYVYVSGSRLMAAARDRIILFRIEHLRHAVTWILVCNDC